MIAKYELASIHDNAYYIGDISKWSEAIFLTSFYLCSGIFDTVDLTFMTQINITSCLFLVIGILPLVLINNIISASPDKKFCRKIQSNSMKFGESVEA